MNGANNNQPRPARAQPSGGHRTTSAANHQGDQLARQSSFANAPVTKTIVILAAARAFLSELALRGTSTTSWVGSLFGGGSTTAPSATLSNVLSLTLHAILNSTSSILGQRTLPQLVVFALVLYTARVLERRWGSSNFLQLVCLAVIATSVTAVAGASAAAAAVGGSGRRGGSMAALGQPWSWLLPPPVASSAVLATAIAVRYFFDVPALSGHRLFTIAGFPVSITDKGIFYLMVGQLLSAITSSASASGMLSSRHGATSGGGGLGLGANYWSYRLGTTMALGAAVGLLHGVLMQRSRGASNPRHRGAPLLFPVRLSRLLDRWAAGPPVVRHSNAVSDEQQEVLQNRGSHEYSEQLLPTQQQQMAAAFGGLFGAGGVGGGNSMNRDLRRRNVGGRGAGAGGPSTAAAVPGQRTYHSSDRQGQPGTSNSPQQPGQQHGATASFKDEELMYIVEALGVDVDVARRALVMSNGNTEAAMNLVLDGNVPLQ